MANLSGLRVKISSVQSTQKVTGVMKMISAAKLKQAQDVFDGVSHSADALETMLEDYLGLENIDMLHGNGKDLVHLLIVIASDRGLCGGFNSNAAKLLTEHARKLLKNGKRVKIITIGNKVKDLINNEFSDIIVESLSGIYEKNCLNSGLFDSFVKQIVDMFHIGEFDICDVICMDFITVMSQVAKIKRLIPFCFEINHDVNSQCVIESEPSTKIVCEALLKENIIAQLRKILFASLAGEHSARMRAMDSASNNAKDMLDRLKLLYNRTRQAAITNDIIEVISGASAV